MVENIFRHLSESAGSRHIGEAHLHRSRTTIGFSGKFGIIANSATEVNKAILFSAAIIIAGFVPLFTLSGIEGHIFGPMASTYAYAIAGGLIAEGDGDELRLLALTSACSFSNALIVTPGVSGTGSVLWPFPCPRLPLPPRLAVLPVPVPPVAPRVWDAFASFPFFADDNDDELELELELEGANIVAVIVVL